MQAARRFEASEKEALRTCGELEKLQRQSWGDQRPRPHSRAVFVIDQPTRAHRDNKLGLRGAVV